MRISVFGLGYVGSVSAACLANEGHEVIGVDPNGPKVDLINDGKAPIVERDLAELVAETVARKCLRATTDAQEAIENTDFSFICVGTPSQANGNLELKYVRQVSLEIGRALRSLSDFHVVVARSTMLPGSMKSVVIPTLEEASEKRSGVDFGVCLNPEFLREGTAVADYRNPPKTVIGADDNRSAELLAQLYTHLDAPLIRTTIDVAEMVKYMDNTWHALKVGFANEIGTICKALGVDTYRVTDIFLHDTKLNISPAYLRPGFAFGGSCLPKDLRALIYRARALDLELPILQSVLPSNERHIERGVQMIIAHGRRRVGVLGFSFKSHTDDLRESPMVEVIERLVGKGFDLRLYDRDVNLARLVGANREYIMAHVPHISRLMVEQVDEVVRHAEVLVIGNDDPAFREIMQQLSSDTVVVDLTGVVRGAKPSIKYDGICW